LKDSTVKTGKKIYCDLMFTNENEKFIQWMENLENYCQKIIYENRGNWFETELDMHDIENSFISPFKLYKSGKYYLVRTTIPNVLGKCTLKIYDEYENEVEFESLKENNDIMTIIEIQGIKCSARSFQIEIEVKQMLLLKPSNIFERCVIKYDNKMENKVIETIKKVEEPSCKIENNLGEKEEESMIIVAAEGGEEKNDLEKMDENVDNEEKDLEKYENELCEVEFNLDEIEPTETVQLKNRNDVYYKMYKDARKRAKEARDLALSSFLEARRIKNTYMLEDVESDSDLESMNFEEE
jgi:hypothetical protein